MEKKFEIKVYDDKGKVKKTCVAEAIDLEFGTIRKIMEILNIEEKETTTQLLSTVYGAWDQLVNVMSQSFPDMQYEDWEHVKIREFLPVMVGIIKYSISEMLTVPKDPKN